MTSACYCHVVENGDSIADDDGVNGSLFEGCNDAGFLADGRHSPQHNTTDDVGNAQLPSPFSSPVYSPLTPPKKVHNVIFSYPTASTYPDTSASSYPTASTYPDASAFSYHTTSASSSPTTSSSTETNGRNTTYFSTYGGSPLLYEMTLHEAISLRIALREATLCHQISSLRPCMGASLEETWLPV